MDVLEAGLLYCALGGLMAAVALLLPPLPAARTFLEVSLIALAGWIFWLGGAVFGLDTSAPGTVVVSGLFVASLLRSPPASGMGVVRGSRRTARPWGPASCNRAGRYRGAVRTAAAALTPHRQAPLAALLAQGVARHASGNRSCTDLDRARCMGTAGRPRRSGRRDVAGRDPHRDHGAGVSQRARRSAIVALTPDDRDPRVAVRTGTLPVMPAPAATDPREEH